MYGAYSDLACRNFYKYYKTLPCRTFEEAFNSVINKEANYAMIPVENSIAGRVADIQFLLEKTNLKIIGEHFLRIEHHLLAKSSKDKKNIKKVYSHIHALSQCKVNIKKLNLFPVSFIDTAGAAEFISNSETNDSAIASELSAKIYKLEIIKRNLEDKKNNITRFLVFSRNYKNISINKKVITTITFNTKNVPAALYKALGCFAEEKINLTRLESFFVNKKFEKSSFLVDVETHPETKNFKLVLNKLNKYSNKINILGFYESSNFTSLIK